MPVYKDTAANRKLDRVGKHFGKRIKFIKTADKEYLPRRGLATQTRDFGIIEKKRNAQQQKYSDIMVKLLKESPLPTIVKDSDITGFQFRGDNYKWGTTKDLKKERKEKIKIYEQSFNDKLKMFLFNHLDRNDLLKEFTDAVKERVSELYNIKSTVEPKALKLYTLN